LNILVAVIGLAGSIALIHLYANPLFMLSKDLPKPIRLALFRIFIPSALVVSVGIVAQLTPRQFALAIAIFVIPLIFLEFVFPLFAQRNVRGYLNKLVAQDQTELNHKTIIDFAADAVGRKALIFSALLFGLSFVAYLTGAFEAKAQRNFMVIEGNPERVVVKRNSNFFLVAQFDRASKTLSNEFTIFYSEKQTFGFRYENMGPLRPASAE
jgi:hypothetical protein